MCSFLFISLDSEHHFHGKEVSQESALKYAWDSSLRISRYYCWRIRRSLVLQLLCRIYRDSSIGREIKLFQEIFKPLGESVFVLAGGIYFAQSNEEVDSTVPSLKMHAQHCRLRGYRHHGLECDPKSKHPWMRCLLMLYGIY